jgi:hypothetical protein
MNSAPGSRAGAAKRAVVETSPAWYFGAKNKTGMDRMRVVRFRRILVVAERRMNSIQRAVRRRISAILVPRSFIPCGRQDEPVRKSEFLLF